MRQHANGFVCSTQMTVGSLTNSKNNARHSQRTPTISSVIPMKYGIAMARSSIRGKNMKNMAVTSFKYCLPLCAISPSSAMIKKELFDKVGLFDENLPACEDYDMWLRICCQYPVLFLDEALTNKFGGHEDQLSRQHWGMDRFRIIALQKCIESQKLSASDREAAIDMLINKIGIFLKGAEKHGKNEHCEEFEALAEHYGNTLCLKT